MAEHLHDKPNNPASDFDDCKIALLLLDSTRGTSHRIGQPFSAKDEQLLDQCPTLHIDEQAYVKRELANKAAQDEGMAKLYKDHPELLKDNHNH